IDALTQRDAQPAAFSKRQFAESPVIGRAHVREARAEVLVVGARERVYALQIDVIRKNHEPSLRELFFDSARGIRQDYRFHAHSGKYPDGESDILHRVAFIKVHATL